MAALPPAIQPDGHQRQQRKPLLTQLKLHAEQPDGVHQPAQKHHVDPVQGQHLSQQAPPFPAPENVKSEHGQHTGTVVICHAQRSQQRPCCCHCGAHRQRDPELLLFAHRFHQMHPQKSQQQRPNITVGDDGIIFIQPGDSFETVMTTLISSGYVKNEYTLRKLAELKKYPSAVKTGRYRLVDKMNNNQLINMLRAGRQEPVHLTFNNIRTLEDFAAILSRQLGIDSTEFLQLARNAEYVKKLSFTPENFIGMFIPNTYQVYWHTPVEDFIQRMYKEYRKFWTEERLVKARKADLSPMDILILASIVEEETNIADEYPVIAGVYINRLNKGWKLEACPTLKFAWGDFSIRRVLDKHMEIDSPYNTYKNTGLPPGPVRMPSIRVIDAVLNYQHHDYMFFCAKSDFSGSHYFSHTLREHNRHANEYHRALNIKRIY